MAQREYSDYQKKVISQYYDHLDLIMLDKLQELVSELYVADTEAKKNRLWQRVHKAMIGLKIPPALVEHLMGKRDVEVLAQNLQDWLKHSSRKR